MQAIELLNFALMLGWMVRVSWQCYDKRSYSVLDEGFVPFPKKRVRCLNRIFTGVNCAKELTVVLAIADVKRTNLSRPPSSAHLAFLAGLEEADFDVLDQCC
jgi:hypothetical protein